MYNRRLNMIRLATVFSGIGAVEQALEKIKLIMKLFLLAITEREVEETKEEILKKQKVIH